MTDQRLLDLGLGIFIFQSEELENERVLELFLWGGAIDQFPVIVFCQHCHFVSGYRCALIKCTVDLAIELLDRPSAAQSFCLIKLSGQRVLNREEADIMRPGK